MNRDQVPSGTDVALAAAELMATARRLTARLPRLGVSTPAQLASAVAVVRAGVREIWPAVVPEAARDVMITAAQVAVEAGVTVVPDAAAAMFPGGQVDGADGMLELTAEWIAAGRPGPGSYPGGFMPPFAFASSVAFDRDEDDQTLTSVSVLLTLAHLAAPAARRPGR